MAEHGWAGDDELGALLRSHDWSQTPLGAIETWSEDLKTTAQILLTELKLTPSSQATPPDDAQHQANQLNAFRVKLAKALHPLRDASEIQAIAARVLGEFLGATRVIYVEIVSAGEEVIVHCGYTHGVAKLSGRFRLEDYRRNLAADHQAGHTQVVTDIPNDPTYTEAEKTKYRDVDIAAHIDVPLIKNNQFVALLAAQQSTPRQWTDIEVKLVEETAEQTWAAVERAYAEAALRESEAKYRTLFESIDEGFCIVEMMFDENDTPIDYRFLEINSVFEQQTGLQQALGKTARQLVPDLEAFWIEIYGRVALTGESIRFENRSVSMGRWFDVYACRTGQPEDRKVAIVFNDISDRKQAEEAIYQSEERYRLLAEVIPQFVWITDANGQNEYVNQRFCDYTGLTTEQLRDSNWFSALHPDDVELARDRWSMAVRTGQFYEIEYRFRGTDGNYRWFLGQGIPLKDTQGQIYKWFGTCTDIEPQKQIEQTRLRLLTQEQAAREQAEAANRIKDEFLAVLSHELRSPLNPILGWTRLLQNGKLDAARQKEALATIERNAKLQTQLIEDLLDISRIMRGKLSLSVAPVSLSYVIMAAMETVRLAADAKNIQIILDLASGVAPVSGDAARLQQIVWNLLTNAVKFTPDGGQVTVELRQLHQVAQIRVSDTGKGINPQFLPYVFEYFRQEDGSTTRKFGGLGLGLAIARQIVEMHGGTVQVESQGEGQGATFIVQLPTLRQTPSASTPTPSQTDAERRLKGLHILLVDDEPDTREFQTFLLEHNGARVIAVASGIDALQVLDQSIPDVLVSDIGMADMDGYRLLQQIRSRPPEKGGLIPAIALTAYATELDQQHALQVGFQTHLTKPIEPEQLVQAIAMLLKYTG